MLSAITRSNIELKLCFCTYRGFYHSAIFGTESVVTDQTYPNFSSDFLFSALEGMGSNVLNTLIKCFENTK